MVVMSSSPFSARPTSPEGERRRARLIVAIATAGIAATLLAYAISPGVRHAVGHAAHSVKHAVGHVFDPDEGLHHKPRPQVHVVVPLRPRSARRPAPARQTAPAGTSTTTSTSTATTTGTHSP